MPTQLRSFLFLYVTALAASSARCAEPAVTPEKERVRQEVNAWIYGSGEFDGVIDFDEAVRDPAHRTQLAPSYDSGDHLHVNDAGNVAQGNAIALELFKDH